MNFFRINIVKCRQHVLRMDYTDSTISKILIIQFVGTSCGTHGNTFEDVRFSTPIGTNQKVKSSKW